MRENQMGQGRSFLDLNEIMKALENKVITLHTKITSRVKDFENNYSRV
jgi:hypothetical protein